MLSDKDLGVIQKHPLFANLSSDILQKMLHGAFPRNYAKGDMLFLRGDPSELFYMVLEGWVKVFRETPDGEVAVLGVFTQGESIAEAVAFLDQGYPASAQVVDDARLLPIRTSVVRQLIRDTPEIAFNMLASMSRHMHNLVTEVEQLKTRTALQRVSEFLLKLCAVQDGPAVVFLPYDKSLISHRLGMQPESFSRILARLRKLGVETQQERVIIQDVAVLANFCITDADEDQQSA